MINQLGQKVRELRSQMGFGLNEFARKIGVSPGYLSNLETGKTDTIPLAILEKLQNELQLLPLKDEPQIFSEIELRCKKINRLLHQLNSENPEAVEYLLSTIEKGLDLFK